MRELKYHNLTRVFVGGSLELSGWWDCWRREQGRGNKWMLLAPHSENLPTPEALSWNGPLLWMPSDQCKGTTFPSRTPWWRTWTIVSYVPCKLLKIFSYLLGLKVLGRDFQSFSVKTFQRTLVCFRQQLKHEENSKNAAEWSQETLSITCNYIFDIFRDLA